MAAAGRERGAQCRRPPLAHDGGRRKIVRVLVHVYDALGRSFVVPGAVRLASRDYGDGLAHRLGFHLTLGRLVCVLKQSGQRLELLVMCGRTRYGFQASRGCRIRIRWRKRDLYWCKKFTYNQSIGVNVRCTGVAVVVANGGAGLYLALGWRFSCSAVVACFLVLYGTVKQRFLWASLAVKNFRRPRRCGGRWRRSAILCVFVFVFLFRSVVEENYDFTLTLLEGVVHRRYRPRDTTSVGYSRNTIDVHRK